MFLKRAAERYQGPHAGPGSQEPWAQRGEGPGQSAAAWRWRSDGVSWEQGGPAKERMAETEGPREGDRVTQKL